MGRMKVITAPTIIPNVQDVSRNLAAAVSSNKKMFRQRAVGLESVAGLIVIATRRGVHTYLHNPW
jgi:hypothetical protein